MSTALADLAPDVRTTVAQVPRGEGRMLVVAGHKLLVYRADDDTISAYSPLCPHMRGALSWNGQEHTWDCAFHGGRFSATGAFVHGPGGAAMNEFDLRTLG